MAVRSLTTRVPLLILMLLAVAGSVAARPQHAAHPLAPRPAAETAELDVVGGYLSNALHGSSWTPLAALQSIVPHSGGAPSLRGSSTAKRLTQPVALLYICALPAVAHGATLAFSNDPRRRSGALTSFATSLPPPTRA